MFCNNCGSNMPDGVKFCTNCGAKLEVPAAVPQKRKALIAPAILALLSALLFLFMWATNFRAVGYYASVMRDEPFYAVLLVRIMSGPLLSMLAALFAALFCLTQYRKGKTSLLGLSALMLVLNYLGAVLYFIALALFSMFSDSFGVSLSWSWPIYCVLDLACGVLSFILMIGAFKGKVLKGVAVILGCFMLVVELFSAVTGGHTLSAVADTLAGVSLAVAILLIGILAKKK